MKYKRLMTVRCTDSLYWLKCIGKICIYLYIFYTFVILVFLYMDFPGQNTLYKLFLFRVKISIWNLEENSPGF